VFFNINTSNGVPVYEQIARQIVFAVANRGIESGELVPSVRNLSRELAVNPNTVARAYRQLQDSGVLETVPCKKQDKVSSLRMKSNRSSVIHWPHRRSWQTKIELEKRANTMAIVELNDVVKSYRSVKAMDQVSFTIPSGVVFALLGENGAGKTTTIKSMLGLEAPNSGAIKVMGMNPRKEAIAIRRAIGYVPDAPKLYDWMKVSQIAWFAGGFYPEGFVAEFTRLAAEFELPMNVKIKTLSKGGKAKVALALAMSHRPELLILDEPTSGLDTLVRRKFLESMVDVASEGRTVFLSSHQIPEVERVADYVAIMNEGKIRVCEKLDVLKAEIEQWVVTLDNPNHRLPPCESSLLTHEGIGQRRQQLTVRSPDPNTLWALRDMEGVLQVDVHTPSLEEIFVAYLKSGKSEQPLRQVDSKSNRTSVDQEAKS